MKKYVKKMFALLATIFTFVALTTTASACSVVFYQPEVPEALREE